MDYEAYENPADDENETNHHGQFDANQNDDGNNGATEMMMDDEEDIPVTQEDAWAVIRYIHTYIYIHTVVVVVVVVVATSKIIHTFFDRSMTMENSQ
jgi:hypothetical protein